MQNKESSSVVEMNDFSFNYAGSKDLNLSHINLNIKAGEFILLTGRSGCGKTTITRCINGLIPDFFEGNISGECLVYGMNIKENETINYSSYVGSVFQDPRSQFFTLHVKTEIPFVCENLGMKKAEIQNGFNESVQALKIENLLGKSIFQLSSGEKQKVAAASVYSAKVNIFVLDEPSANLDSEGTNLLFHILKKLKEEGNTIIVSEHKLYYLKELIDRVVFMQDGKIKENMTKDEFCRKPTAWFLENGLRQIELSNIKPSMPNIKFKSRNIKMKAENISFYYDRKYPVWKNISFEAESGEIIGVIGKNGAGKSTLFKVLMGLEKSKSGKIYINEKYSSKKRRKRHSFYVMQDVDYQLFASSVLEEMLLGTLKIKEEENRALEILKYFKLDCYADRHPSELSGGQKQRLSIALACMSNADFLFLDEPTSGLDGENMILVRNAVYTLAERGCCVFVITHDYEFAANILNSLIVLKSSNEFEYISKEKYDPKMLAQNFIFQ